MSPLFEQPSCPLATVLSFQPPSPFCHPERSRISYFTALNSATYVVLPKENHMQLTEATTLNRKSGEAEGSAVRPSGASHAPGSNKVVIPSEAGFTTSQALNTATYVVPPKENHMQLTEATTLNRKSGEADLRFHGPLLENAE